MYLYRSRTSHSLIYSVPSIYRLYTPLHLYYARMYVYHNCYFVQYITICIA
jgi:hypothetical protein